MDSNLHFFGRILTVITTDRHCEFMKITTSDYKKVIEVCNDRNSILGHPIFENGLDINEAGFCLIILTLFGFWCCIQAICWCPFPCSSPFWIFDQSLRQMRIFNHEVCSDMHFTWWIKWIEPHFMIAANASKGWNRKGEFTSVMWHLQILVPSALDQSSWTYWVVDLPCQHRWEGFVILMWK